MRVSPVGLVIDGRGACVRKGVRGIHDATARHPHGRALRELTLDDADHLPQHLARGGADRRGARRGQGRLEDERGERGGAWGPRSPENPVNPL
eukprot:1036759-Pyramimonas_sp.AAC.1